MDLHPIFVHFPIALLCIWSLVEIANPGKWFKSVDWQSAQKILLFVGFAGSLVALSTGETAEHLAGRSALIEAHSAVATATTWLYGLFVADIVLKFAATRFQFLPAFVKKITTVYNGIFSYRWLRAGLAFIAVAALFLTGLLGGAIVYGTTADPLAKYVLGWLGL